MKNFVKIVLALLLFVPVALLSQQIPPRPNPPKLVNDIADVLTPEQESALEKKLVALDDSTSNQVAIVLVKTLNDYPIEEFAIQLFRQWQIGSQAHNNGVLILAAIDDRKVRIEPGYGLEGAIPDITANQIITNDIVPAFREKRYYDGLDAATNSIIAAAAGEYTAPENYHEGRRRTRFPVSLIVIIVVLILIFSRRGGGGGGLLSRRGYRGGFGPVFFPGSGGSWGGGGWSGGGGGFGGGGGGFGGFGGGSSGGGGASGSW